MSAPLGLTVDARPTRGGRVLTPATWSWDQGTEPATAVDTAAAALRATAARHSLRHLVIGVIGPRDATGAQLIAAETIGRALAGLGVTMICGGKGGVMQAACKGNTQGGGAPIGILPGHAPDDANPFVAIPLPTGLSEGRNMVIAKAARVLIAVGGSYGTLSEVAYGLHFGKAVIGVEGAPRVDGVRHAGSAEAAVEATAQALLDCAAVSSNSHADARM